MPSDIDRARYLEAQRQRRQRLREIRDASGVWPSRQAFARMGISEFMGYRMIRDGSLKARRRGRSYFITEAEIARQLSMG